MLFRSGSFVAWYSWTQVARTKVFHMPEYQPPPSYLLLASAVIVLLVAAAFGPWASTRPGQPATGRSAPDPHVVGSIAFLFGLPWSALVLQAFGFAPQVPFQAMLIAGVAWVCAVLSLFARWTSGPNWDDRHRFAVVSGGIFACMTGGFVVFAVGGALPVDWIGKAVLNLIAVVWLARLGGSLRREPRAAAA